MVRFADHSLGVVGESQVVHRRGVTEVPGRRTVIAAGVDFPH